MDGHEHTPEEGGHCWRDVYLDVWAFTGARQCVFQPVSAPRVRAVVGVPIQLLVHGSTQIHVVLDAFRKFACRLA